MREYGGGEGVDQMLRGHGQLAFEPQNELIEQRNELLDLLRIRTRKQLRK